MIHQPRATLSCIAIITTLSLVSGFVSCTRPETDILETTGIKGGLVLHVGCGDGRLTALLHGNDSYLVHGLDSDPENVTKARQHIRELGLLEKVSVEQWNGTSMPYIDNLANLVVAEHLGEIPLDEVMRVLAPNGVAYVRQEDGQWSQKTKPWPEEIDEWTHYYHDATGNPVARDLKVGPPRRLQWTGGPKWSRHHDHMASLSALVSANGRVFYIIDEGPKESVQLPPKWVLVARDAFNGVQLWKRPIENWYNHLWPFKSGHGQLPRRLVATGDRVYVTLGINSPVGQLDASTGEVIQTYEGTRTAEEILYSDNTLFLLVNPSREPVTYAQEHANVAVERDRASFQWGWDEKPRILMAIDPHSGSHLWKMELRVLPMSLASDGKQLVFHDGESLICLDPVSGNQIWQSEPIERMRDLPTGYQPSLRIYEDVVLFSGKHRSLTAVSLEDGDQLWTAQLHPSGHFSPEDIIVIDGLVWSGDIAWGNRRETSSTGLYTGRDIHTGEVKKEFPIDVDTFFMHQRCHPSKATSRYIIPSWTGTEFVDLEKQHWEIHHWVRGSCVYGVMPSNGLLYTPPHSCACYYQSKLYGFCALAPAQEPAGNKDPDRADRLVRGPAYGQISQKDSRQPASQEWPTYRHDAGRSGFIEMKVPVSLTPTWRTHLDGQLTSLVAANGKLFVASVDEHTVYALDADSGDTLWRFSAGGRVDSPPTIHDGCVVFGSADGWVYCLRVSDGELVWRFRAAPADLRHVAYGQIESVWPVHASVLVQDGTVYCIAGRSMFLDGGMRLLRLDPWTGRKISETVLDDRVPETGENLQTLINVKKMPVALPDILSSDGNYVFMRSQRFDLEGRRAKLEPEHQTDQQGDGIHLFSPLGFTDDTWFHRGYWIYGKNAGEGWGEWFIPGRLVPSGRILTFNEDYVYGYGRDPEYLTNSSVLEYRLFAANKHFNPERGKELKRAKEDSNNWQTRAELQSHELSAVDYRWVKEHPPLLVTAMTLAGDTLFVAGPPDLVDEKEARGHFLEPEIRARLDQQLAAHQGHHGGILRAVSADNGDTIAEYQMEAPPRFDGMIAAYGRLYLVLSNGDLVCYGPTPG